MCQILRLSRYQFFRSTAHRPNLQYSVQPKPADGQAAIMEQMAEFIKTKYPHGAGIVYTYSRKDADTVADALCEYGVIAEVRKANFLVHPWMPPSRLTHHLIDLLPVLS